MPSAALEHGNSGLKVTVLRAGGQHSLGVVQHTSGTHAGSYVVAPPGEAFVVRVERDPEDDYTDTIRVELFVDERYAGYSKLLYRTHPRGHFTGFLVAGGQVAGEGACHNQTQSTYAEFKFANFAGPSMVHAPVVTDAKEIQTGRLKLKFWQTVKAGVSSVPRGAEVQDAAMAKLPDGKKFFMQPSLKTASGQKRKLDSTWSKTEWAKFGDPVWEPEIRYETVDTLVLRGVLSLDNPAHHPLMAACTITKVREMLGLPMDSEQQAGPDQKLVLTPQTQTQVKREQAGAGSSWQPSPADNVVFDLTQCDQPASQAQAKPLVLPDGRVAGKHDIVTCDLAESDDDAAPTWDIVKRESTQV